jgi:transposase, IS30 family
MPKGYHHLTYSERCQIYALRGRGDSQSSIAKALSVHRSTICRELKRNTGLKGYRCRQAQRKADEKRRESSQGASKLHTNEIDFIEKGLKLQWSPEQISGSMGLKEDLKKISHETIYKFVWQDKRSGGSLYKELRHHGKKYNRRSKSTAGRGCIPERVGIEERPAIVEEKSRVGDWELDSIVGANHKGAIISMVDRASKLTKLRKVLSKTSADATNALVTRLSPIKEFVHTLTADNGKEFAGHRQVSSSLDADFYFAHPYSSWERGLNEHTNGLVRQYFPKGTSFEEITDEQVARVEDLLNGRPRKVLGYQTPMEFFEKNCYHPNDSKLKNISA